MHGLRIELRREGDDLLAADEAGSVFGNAAFDEIFPEKFRHGTHRE